MKPLCWLTFGAVILLSACQPTVPPTVTVIDNDKVITLQTDERVPSVILDEAGITLNPSDRILFNGLPITPDETITNYPITFQIRRAVTITIYSPQGQQTLQTSAFTVGEALQEAGIQLSANDE